MPLADFNGEFGWGYDGVAWFAPTRLYGTPDDAGGSSTRRTAWGLGVILDVVYNHFGSCGNYTGGVFVLLPVEAAPDRVGRRDQLRWRTSRPGPRVRHLERGVLDRRVPLRRPAARRDAGDHRRFAATCAGGAVAATRRRRASGRSSHWGERAAGRASHHAVDAGGFGLDGLWNDDFHHTCRVAATGHAEFYYADYAGSPQEIVSAVRRAYLYQGQYVAAHATAPRDADATQSRGAIHALFAEPRSSGELGAGAAASQLTSAGRYRALTAVLLLGPETPMLFMGQEFGSTTPFNYFADHDVDLAKLVREGRWGYIRNFPRTAKWGDKGELADPSSRETFEKSKLDWNECERNKSILDLHRDLLRLRREDPIFRLQDWSMIDGAVVGPEAFLLRWLPEDEQDRLMCVNLGRDFEWRPTGEPLAAPPAGKEWRLLWSSESFEYGGAGTPPFDAKGWVLPGHTAIVLEAVGASEH